MIIINTIKNNLCMILNIYMCNYLEAIDNYVIDIQLSTINYK